MSNIGTTDFALEAALGNEPQYSTLNKFGQARDCDSAVATDIWDGADGTTSTDVWVPPTTSRIHDIKSGSLLDNSAASGCQTVRVYGLTAWDADEVSEDITMNGTTNVPTVNSYVIIHRIKGLTFGASGTNAGIITATAQTDATVTAAIKAGEGQTLMAIYGVPSTKKIAITDWVADMVGNVNADAEMTLLVDERADQSDSGFLTKDRKNLKQNTPINRRYGVPKTFAGPCIVKVQALSDTNNTSITSAFDAYLKDV